MSRCIICARIATEFAMSEIGMHAHADRLWYASLCLPMSCAFHPTRLHIRYYDARSVYVTEHIHTYIISPSLFLSLLHKFR